MWLLHMEGTDDVKKMHCRKCREYSLTKLPRFTVDGYCLEACRTYDFFGCYYHGHTCQPFRDVNTLRGETLGERYEQTMSRLEKIT